MAKSKKVVNVLSTPEHRTLLLNLSAVAPGKFFQQTDRSVKAEGQGKILKILQPKRKMSGKLGKIYGLVVYVCYHTALDKIGLDWKNEVIHKLKTLGRAEVITEEKGQNGKFLTFGIGLNLQAD